MQLKHASAENPRKLAVCASTLPDLPELGQTRRRHGSEGSNLYRRMSRAGHRCDNNATLASRWQASSPARPKHPAVPSRCQRPGAAVKARSHTNMCSYGRKRYRSAELRAGTPSSAPYRLCRASVSLSPCLFGQGVSVEVPIPGSRSFRTGHFASLMI